MLSLSLSLLLVTYITFDVQSVEHFLVRFLEVTAQLEFGLLRGHVVLHFRVRIVDDGQEHVQQDEEHEEDVGEKEDGPENAMSIQNG